MVSEEKAAYIIPGCFVAVYTARIFTVPFKLKNSMIADVVIGTITVILILIEKSLGIYCKLLFILMILESYADLTLYLTLKVNNENLYSFAMRELDKIMMLQVIPYLIKKRQKKESYHLKSYYPQAQII